MRILYLIIIVFIVFIYFLTNKKYNNNSILSLKKFLETTNGIYIEKLLLLPISKFKNFANIKISKHIKSPSPIILIPNIGSNKLYYNNKKIWLNSNYFQIKNDSDKNFSEIFKPELIHGNLIDEYDLQVSRVSNYIKEEFNITNDFGGISSISFLHKIGKYISYEFDPLINFLTKKLNYIPKYNLLGAPYDFRLISNKNNLHSYFKKLKDLIEYSYRSNNKPVTIVCSGLGGIIFTIFIAYYLPLVIDGDEIFKWKKFLIKNFIPINTGFIGSNLSQKALEKGIGEGIGLNFLAHNFDDSYHELQKRIGGLLLMLPDSLIFNEDFSSIEIYNDFVKDILKYRLKDPELPVKAIVSSESNTLIDYKNKIYEQSYYESNASKLLIKLRNNTPLKQMLGDGINTFISQQIPILWNDSKIYRIPGGHRSVINSEKFLKLFYEILSCNK